VRNAYDKCMEKLEEEEDRGSAHKNFVQKGHELSPECLATTRGESGVELLKGRVFWLYQRYLGVIVYDEPYPVC
jgi:hypothetical protein